MNKDIVLIADYHSQNIEFRWFNEATGEERRGKFSTTRGGIVRQVEQSTQELEPGGRVVWVMESTTGWARVKDLLGGRARFVLANVLQMPLPPKGRRRKSDKIDTGRLLREYLHGSLPQSFQPSAWWRQVRRLVDCRQDLVERRTAIKNWIGSLLHHETWEDRKNLWSAKGQADAAERAQDAQRQGSLQSDAAPVATNNRSNGNSRLFKVKATATQQIGGTTEYERFRVPTTSSGYGTASIWSPG